MQASVDISSLLQTLNTSNPAEAPSKVSPHVADLEGAFTHTGSRKPPFNFPEPVVVYDKEQNDSKEKACHTTHADMKPPAPVDLNSVRLTPLYETPVNSPPCGDTDLSISVGPSPIHGPHCAPKKGTLEVPGRPSHNQSVGFTSTNHKTLASTEPIPHPPVLQTGPCNNTGKTKHVGLSSLIADESIITCKSEEALPCESSNKINTGFENVAKIISVDASKTNSEVPLPVPMSQSTTT